MLRPGHSGGKIVLDNISIRTFRTAAASQIRKSTACLPPTIALLKRAAPWIRHVYLNHLTAATSHLFSQYDSLTNVAAMLSAIEQLPEGSEWLQTNQFALARQGLGFRHGRPDSVTTAELIARTIILATLTRMGMARTNLTRLTE